MTQQEYIKKIKDCTSINGLEIILDNATLEYGLWPKVLKKIIECKLSRELDLVFNTAIYMESYEKKEANKAK